MKLIQKFEISKKILIVPIVLIALLAVLLLALFFSPKKRMERATLQAEGAYSMQDYETALTHYKNMVKIDASSMEGYLGILCCHEALADGKEAEAFSDGAIRIANLSEEKRTEKLNGVIEYYLHAKEIFADDLETRVSMWATAYGASMGAEDIVMAFTEDTTDLLNRYTNSGRFEEAFALLDNYGEMLSCDVTALGDQVSAAKKIYSVKENVLAEVFKDLKGYYEKIDADSSDTIYSAYKYDFKDILSYDGTSEVEELAMSKASDHYVYLDNVDDKNTLTGFGSGLYLFGEPYKDEDGKEHSPYYFFIGYFDNGIRTDFGVTFMKTGEDSYRIFAGQFTEDIPNGEGTLFELSTDPEGEVGYTWTTEGTWAKGYGNGDMNLTLTRDAYPGITFEGTMKVKDGVPAEVERKTDDYEVLLDPEGVILTGVIPSKSDGYDIYLTLWEKEGYLLNAMNLQ